MSGRLDPEASQPDNHSEKKTAERLKDKGFQLSDITEFFTELSPREFPAERTTMVDPFSFYGKTPSPEEVLHQAPMDAVNSWLALAEQACTALRNAGLLASHYPSGLWKEQAEGMDFDRNPGGGVHLVAHAVHPFGVVPEWSVPFTSQPGYFEKMFTWSPGEGHAATRLGTYLVDGGGIARDAAVEVLRQQGFHTYHEHVEGDEYRWRVLAGPER